MIRAFFIQLILTACGYFLLWGRAAEAAEAFAIGGALVAANFLILGILWGWIFNKKLIALAVSLIVFKYAILGLIIYRLIKVVAVDPFWFAMGIASFILSALIYALWTTLSRP
jgi:hypothetical protein